MISKMSKTTGVPASFKEFVLALPDWNNPAGDYVREARADRRLPDVRSWLDLREYLLRSGASSDWFPSALRVWQAYTVLTQEPEIRVSERAFGRQPAEGAFEAIETAREADLQELLYLFADAVSYADDSQDARVREAWRPVKRLVEKRLCEILPPSQPGRGRLS